MTEIFALREKHNLVMKQFETAREASVAAAEAFQGKVKQQITEKIAGGATAEEILATENTWADMAMEIKSSVYASAIAIEEYAQTMEVASQKEIRKEFKAGISETYGWIKALEEGAENTEGKIAKVTNTALLADIAELRKIITENYEALANQFMDIQDVLASKAGSMHVIDAQVDSVGEQMLKDLGQIEESASKAMNAANTNVHNSIDMEKEVLLIGLVVGFVLATILGITITRLITKPLKQGVVFAQTIAGGDLTQQLEVKSKDELGELVEALNAMSKNLCVAMGDVVRNTSTLAATSEEMSSNSNEMNISAEQMDQESGNAAVAIGQLSSNLSNVSAGTEETSTNINTVASSIEEMSSSLADVAKRCSDGSEMSLEANNKARLAGETMGSLNLSVEDIGKVIETIRSIADQTNLLALNATIEAASAGDAGKGFAVVANEVKELAKQTAQATEEIGLLITNMVDRAGEAMQATHEITNAIDSLSGTVHAIASVVEEQSLTTNEIASNINGISQAATEVSKNIQEASLGSEDVSKSIQNVSAAAKTVKTGADQANAGSNELAKMGARLQQMTEQFKTE